MLLNKNIKVVHRKHWGKKALSLNLKMVLILYVAYLKWSEPTFGCSYLNPKGFVFPPGIKVGAFCSVLNSTVVDHFLLKVV